MSKMPKRLSRMVRRRALDHCEYCGLSQEGQEATFHIDHVIPQSMRGPTKLANLALACVSCSLRKGSKTRARDPMTAVIVPLFHPRKHRWRDHFNIEGYKIIGITPLGRATLMLLQFNRPRFIAIRHLEWRLGRFPPPKAWGDRPIKFQNDQS
jgi:HNH endonuclease